MTTATAPDAAHAPAIAGSRASPAPISPPVANTNAAVATGETPPQPEPLKLQAIFFTPGRPSVMIGGKTLFVGDRVGEFRILAITPNSATLEGAGQKKVLSLPE